MNSFWDSPSEISSGNPAEVLSSLLQTIIFEISQGFVPGITLGNPSVIPSVDPFDILPDLVCGLSPMVFSSFSQVNVFL